MKIISWNVNGLKSVLKRNFLNWVGNSEADIICLQEIKIQLDEMKAALLKPKNFFFYFNCGKRKGMWGVGVLTKEKPIELRSKMGIERFDNEGRFLELKYPRFTLINFYAPHGGRQKENLNYKLEVYEEFLKYLKERKNENLIIAGDFNIAHREIDLARPKENENNTMFTSREREQIEKLIKLGFVDAFRYFHKDGGNYTWWPYSFNARERNLGWRIDYIFVSKSLISKLKDAFIMKEIEGSDHCPIGIEIEVK
jgi:exodeoxyribonuclease-3